MKNKIITISIIISIFLLFVTCKCVNQKTGKYKILDIKNYDIFCIDINKNGEIDNDELFKLNDIYILTPQLNDFTKKNIDRYKLDKNDYLKSGYLTYIFTKSLIGKYVTIGDITKNKNNKYIYTQIFINNENLANIYLKNGLAILKENITNYEYYSYLNISQIKKNSKELSDLNFVVINTHSNIFHKLNCEHISDIKNAIIELKKIAKEKNIPCKSCHKKITDNQKTIEKNIQNTNIKTQYKNFNYIELYLISPYVYNKPNSNCEDDVCKRIVKEIDNSKTSIDIAIFEYSDIPKITNALLNAKKRKVKIRTIVNYSENTKEKYPDTYNFIQNNNSITNNSKTLMHNKIFIFDNKKVMTGSANISPTGLTYNSNIVAFINSKDIANQYLNEFEKMYNKNFSTYKTTQKNQPINFNNSSIQIFFQPKDDIYNNLISNEIKNAKKEIFISIFYLTDKNLIQELINAKKRGVNVLILIDSLGAMNFKERIKLLRNENIPVKVENWGGKNHEKTIMIDSKILIFGSCNFSKSGFYKNDENIVVINNNEIAQFYKKYFLDLFNSIDKKYLKLFPRAEGKDSINSCFDGIDNNFDGKTDLEDEGCKSIK